MDVLIDLPEIEGYEYTGEFRCPKAGEYYLDGSGVSCIIMEAVATILGVRFHIIRPIRWRAEIGQAYYHVHDNGILPLRLCVRQATDVGYPHDAVRFKSGNYFQTKEEAEAMAEKVRALFKEGL